jgi:hypothetical protein
MYTGPSRAYSIKMIAESADGTVQEWVDFYMIGGDGGMLRGARKVSVFTPPTSIDVTSMLDTTSTDTTLVSHCSV